jgi:hypothetical protein
MSIDGAWFSVLKHFSGEDGTAPNDNLILSGSTLYGTAIGGGVSNAGVVFALGYPPAVVKPPQAQTAEQGTLVSLAVTVDSSTPVRYQWLIDGLNSRPDATNSSLVLHDAQFSQAGAYAVVASNLFGSVTSPPVYLSVIAPVDRKIVPAIILKAEAGTTLNLHYADFLSQTPTWSLLDSIVLSNSPQWYFDQSAPLPSQRFYRAGQTGAPIVIPALTLPGMVPALTLTGTVGNKVRIDAINRVGPTDAWFTLATITLTNTTQLYFDTTTFGQQPLLYRLVPVP